MSQWAEFNLQTLFPGPVAEATEQVGNVCEQIGATAETIASAIETLANLLVDVTDPLRAVIQELITLLEETMSDVLHTGLYFYYDCAGWPFYQVRSFDWDKIKQAMAEGEAHGADIREGDVKPEDLPLGTTAVAYGWPGWQARWKKSLDDLGDLERPIFSDNAEVGAIFLVAGTPSLDGFLMLIRAIGELLGIKAFEDAWDRFVVTILDADAKKGDRSIVVKDITGFAEDDWIVVGPLAVALPSFTYIKSIDKATRNFVLTDPLPQDFAKGSPVAMTGSAAAANNRLPTAPDWSSLTLVEIIPFLEEVDALVKKICGLLRMADGFLALLQELAAILKKRAQKLRQIAQMITDLIERIMAILTLTGLFVLKVESSTGFPGLYEAITEADDSFPLPADSFVFGACLLAGGADFGPLAAFLGV